jgi:hypothetical protein
MPLPRYSGQLVPAVTRAAPCGLEACTQGQEAVPQQLQLHRQLQL